MDIFCIEVFTELSSIIYISIKSHSYFIHLIYIVVINGYNYVCHIYKTKQLYTQNSHNFHNEKPISHEDLLGKKYMKYIEVCINFKYNKFDS